MNFNLAGEGGKKRTGPKSCCYCNEVFSDYRALAGHLKVHQEGRLRTWTYPRRFSSTGEIARNPPMALPNIQQQIVSGVDVSNLAPFTRARPPFRLPWMLGTNETNQANMSNFTGFDPAGSTAAMSATTIASSGSTLAVDFPSNPSLHVGSTGICQFNTDEFQPFSHGWPSSALDDVQNFQALSLGTISPGPYQGSDLDKVSQYEKESILASEGGKRPYLADGSGCADSMDVSKKPKISTSPSLEPEKRKITEPSLDDEDIQEDVDLSLHL